METRNILRVYIILYIYSFRTHTTIIDVVDVCYWYFEETFVKNRYILQLQKKQKKDF